MNADFLREFAKVFGVGPSANGWTYSWWSGFGSCLTYIGALGMAWRHLNCHAQGCWRVGRHEVAGTPYKVCLKHHPETPDRRRDVTLEHIHQAHRDAHA